MCKYCDVDGEKLGVAERFEFDNYTCGYGIWGNYLDVNIWADDNDYEINIPLNYCPFCGINLKEYNSKIKNRRNHELIYAYPTAICDDFVVFREPLSERTALYHVGMEGYIFYRTLQDAIKYLEEIKENYRKWLAANKNTVTEREPDDDEVYRSYDVEVCENEGMGITVFISSAPLLSLTAVYHWLDGVIAQLKTIKVE